MANKRKKIVVNPEDKALLDFIASGESGGNYNVTNGGYSVNLTGMTIAQVKELQKQIQKEAKGTNRSPAVGRYQIMPKTLDKIIKEMGISDDEIFNEELQDQMGLHLANGRGWQKFKNGKLTAEEFAKQASMEWAALPNPETGKSYYDGIQGNKLNKSVDDFLTVLNNIKSGTTNSEQTSKSQDLFYLNSNRKSQYTGKWEGEGGRPQEMINERKRIEDNYINSVSQIQSNESLSPIQKKQEIENLHKKLYSEGNLGIVESFVDKENKRRAEFLKNHPDWDTMSSSEKDKILLKNGGGFLLRQNASDDEKREYYELRRASLAKPKVYAYQGNVVYPDVRDVNLAYEYPSASLKYYNELYQKENEPAVENKTEESSTQSDGYSSINPDWQDYITSNAQSVQTEALVTQANSSAFLDAFDYAPTTAPSFMADRNVSWIDFLPGAASIAGNIASIAVGMEAADTELPERDEQISEGLLAYAAMQKRISQMGLDPAVEANLKNDLNTMYQFGIDNLVRASAGNRNLVLGNQGQLDEARMRGAMDIALMDVERRDRALQAFGNVMEYINEFDSRRDIANNDREFQIGREKQAVGMQVAHQGFADLIGNIQSQIENRPNGPNDMLRRAFIKNILGYDPYAPDNGQPGSKSYAENIVEQNRAKNAQAKKAREFYKGLSEQEKIAANEIVQNNSFDTFDDFAEYFQTYKGATTITKEQLADDSFVDTYGTWKNKKGQNLKSTEIPEDIFSQGDEVVDNFINQNRSNESSGNNDGFSEKNQTNNRSVFQSPRSRFNSVFDNPFEPNPVELKPKGFTEMEKQAYGKINESIKESVQQNRLNNLYFNK